MVSDRPDIFTELNSNLEKGRKNLARQNDFLQTERAITLASVNLPSFAKSNGATLLWNNWGSCPNILLFFPKNRKGEKTSLSYITLCVLASLCHHPYVIVWLWLTNRWLCLCLPAVCKQVVLRYLISWCDLALKNEQERGSFGPIFWCFLVPAGHREAQEAWNWGSPIAVSITLPIWFLLPGKFFWATYVLKNMSLLSRCFKKQDFCMLQYPACSPETAKTRQDR